MLAKFLWLFDWIGRWQTALWIASLLGLTVSGIVGFLSTTPLWALALLFLSAASISLGVVIGWQNYQLSKPTKSEESPLKIDFEGESNVRWLTEDNPLFRSTKIQRKIYGITVFNNSDRDVKNVAVEIERIGPISNIHNSPYLGLKFRFKPDGKPLFVDLSPRHKERVPLISHINGMVLRDTIRAESTQGYEFHHNKEKHRLFVKVTGSGVPPVTECFTAWVNSEGELQMVAG